MKPAPLFPIAPIHFSATNRFTTCLDVIGNILCLCPNHHAELDYGVIRVAMADLDQVSQHSVDPKFIDYHNTHIAAKHT